MGLDREVWQEKQVPYFDQKARQECNHLINNSSNFKPPLEKRAFEEVALIFPSLNPTFPQQLRTWCTDREFLNDGNQDVDGKGDEGDETNATITHAGTRWAADTRAEEEEAGNTSVDAVTTRTTEAGAEVGRVNVDIASKTDTKDPANTFADPFADISQDNSLEAKVEA
ncbi:hypothetical protein IFR05_005910 [Cadophora sp. M221]|nr:hypothetical protein IFR05_005910 [Cadophora sp. M221]